MEPEPRRPAAPRPKRRRPAARRGWNPVVVGASVGAGLLVVAAVVWAAVHFTKSGRGDPRLIGTWKSDADATIAELRKSRPVTDKQEQALRQIFGKLTITYTATAMTTDFEGKVETHSYRMIAKDEDSVVFKTTSAETKAENEVRRR